MDADSDFRLDPQADGTYIVRKPDGTVLKFAHLYQIPAPANNFDFSDEDRDPQVPRQTLRYGLSSIVDRFGNTVLQVTYMANCASAPCPADAWRVHFVQLSNPARTITFNWGHNPPPSGPFDVVNSIDFPVSGGGPLRADFTFKTNGNVSRIFDGDPPPSGGRDIPRGPSPTYLPLLASITQASQSYSFDYEPSMGGVLKTLTLPTGGRIAYAYSSYTALAPQPCGNCAGCQACVPENDAGEACPPGAGPTEPPLSATIDGCSDAAFKQQFVDLSPAVISRTEQDPLGGTPDSTTTYERRQFASADFPTAPLSPDRIVRRVIVKRPSGNDTMTIATKHVFAASQNWGNGSELSRRYYASCDTGGTPVRSVVQCFPKLASAAYPADRVCGVMESQTQIGSLLDVFSRRPTQQVTWYGANPLVSVKDTCVNSATPASPACWQDDFALYNPNAAEYTTVTRSSNSGTLIYPKTATRAATTAWVCPASGSLPDHCNPWGTLTWLPKLYSCHDELFLRNDQRLPGLELGLGPHLWNADALSNPGPSYRRSVDGVPLRRLRQPHDLHERPHIPVRPRGNFQAHGAREYRLALV